jgi:hypothetical protein
MPALNFWKIKEGLNLSPRTGTPSSPSNGDVYYNAGLNQFQFYQNGSWVALGTGGGGGDLLANGTVPMTASWNMGAYQITMNSVQVGSSAYSISQLRSIASDTSLTFKTNGSTAAGSIDTSQNWILGISGGNTSITLNGALNITTNTVSSNYSAN